MKDAPKPPRIPTPPRGLETSDKVLLILAAVLVLILVGNWAREVSVEALAAYIGTLVATFAGVGAAAYLNVLAFYAQEDRNNRERTDLLAQSLAGELFTVLDILGAGPNLIVPDPSGRNNHIPVVFAQLEPTATEEAIRAGLMGADSGANLGQISNMMRDYSRASDNLYPLARQLQLNPPLILAAYPMALEMERLKTNLIIWCTSVISGLAAQGITMPKDPQFRTNPAYVVTQGSGSSPQGPPQGPPHGPPSGP